MRSLRMLALPLLLSLAAPAAAQEDTVPRRTVDASRLPPDVAVRVAEFVNDPGTTRFNGRTRISAESRITGDVAVIDGPLTLAGHIDGDLVVVNGDLEFLAGSGVTGDVIVVGGTVTGEELPALGGEVIAYSAPLEYRRRGERIVVRGDVRDRDADADADGDEGRSRRGRADFIVGTGNSYNRVEGLPITFGPVFETGGSNPLRLRVAGIYRTEGASGELDADRFGFDARLEQFFGGHRAFRIGGSLYHRVDPIEDWHLTEMESGLSTFFLHTDYRDHYQREGGSVYATLAPPSSPFSGTVEFRTEKNDVLAAGSPWSLFDNDDPWRAQPLVGEGRLNSLAFRAGWDTRSTTDDPSSGWYVQAEVEQALDHDLERPQATELFVPPGGGASILPGREYDAFTHAFVDVRRYNRVNASSRLNLRLLAGGSLDGSTLPPQRQHALGGEGSLPGFGLFSLDCGARGGRVVLSDAEGADQFYPAYGCDRFVLGQAEYRGDLSFRVNVADWDDDDGDDDADSTEGDVDDANVDFGWVLFADVGRAWSRDPLLFDEETAADVGFGITLGRFGAYLAIPVTDQGSGVNFFIRLSPRF